METNQSYHTLIHKIDAKIEGAKKRTVWAKMQESIERTNNQALLVKITSKKSNTIKLRAFFKDIGFSYWDNLENSNIIDTF